MSFPGGLGQAPPTRATTTTTVVATSDPLQNLSAVKARIETVQRFLTSSLNTNTLIGKTQMDMVSAEISAAIHQIIVNGAALLASSPQTQTRNTSEGFDSKSQHPKSEITPLFQAKAEEVKEEETDYEIIELDAVELLAEHFHFCEICGKCFKRDANLRMHMRAHGDQFKTMEALAKPSMEKSVDFRTKKSRFSCPFVGCNRNKQHKKFRPLKSVICVKNHFKRSHCPKMYTCTRCNKKSFSVVADLKSHLKHCGEARWKCSCGTSFSRKDKLFGHMALFEGHMPAVMAEAEEEEEEGEGQKSKGVTVVLVDGEDDEVEVEDCELKDVEMSEQGGSSLNNGILDGLMLDGFGSLDNYSFQDVINSPNVHGFGSGNGWFV